MQGVVWAWCIAIIFAAIFQCSPIEAAWNPLIPGKCINQKAFFQGQAIPNIIIDFLILFIPIPFLLKLHVGKAQKAALLVVFILGYL